MSDYSSTIRNMMTTSSSSNSTTIEPLFTTSQMRAMAIAPYCTASLSLIGSTTIIYVVALHDGSKKLKKSVFFRLLLGVSVFDSLTSIGFLAFGAWAVPEGTGVAYGERGTDVTCSISGVLTGVFLNVSVLYNVFLTLYHVLVVVFEKKDDWISLQTKVEKIFHAIPIVASIGLSLTTNLLDFIQPMYILSGMCGPEPYPPGCMHYEDVECTNGVQVNTAYVQGPILLISFIIIVMSLLSIYRKVWQTEEKLKRYSYTWREPARGRSNNNNNNNDSNDDDDLESSAFGRRGSQFNNSTTAMNASTRSIGSNGSRTKMRLTTKIGRRGLLYTGCFFICYIFYALTYVLPIPATAEHRNVWFPIAFCAKLLTPLQGFFNLLIFLVPRYRELSQPGESLAVFGKMEKSIRLRSGSVSFRFSSSKDNSGSNSNDRTNSNHINNSTASSTHNNNNNNHNIGNPQESSSTSEPFHISGSVRESPQSQFMDEEGGSTPASSIRNVSSQLENQQSFESPRRGILKSPVKINNDNDNNDNNNSNNNNKEHDETLKLEEEESTSRDMTTVKWDDSCSSFKNVAAAAAAASSGIGGGTPSSSPRKKKKNSTATVREEEGDDVSEQHLLGASATSLNWDGSFRNMGGVKSKSRKFSLKGDSTEDS